MKGLQRDFQRVSEEDTLGVFLEVFHKRAVGVWELGMVWESGGQRCGVKALGHVSYPVVKGQTLYLSIAIAAAVLVMMRVETFSLDRNRLFLMSKNPSIIPKLRSYSTK